MKYRASKNIAPSRVAVSGLGYCGFEQKEKEMEDEGIYE